MPAFGAALGSGFLVMPSISGRPHGGINSNIIPTSLPSRSRYGSMTIVPSSRSQRDRKQRIEGPNVRLKNWDVCAYGDELISQADAIVGGAAVAEQEFKAIPDLDYLQLYARMWLSTLPKIRNNAAFPSCRTSPHKKGVGNYYGRELLALQQEGPAAIGFFGTRNMGFTHQQLVQILSYAMVITVKNVIEMPHNDHLPLIEASRICNMEILSHVQQVICFAFHDSRLLLETCREAKALRKIVTLFYLD